MVTTNSIEANVTQATTFVTVGITDHFDLSLAVPVVSNYLKVVSDAKIHRLGTTNPLTHFFRQANGEVGEERIFTAIGSATGTRGSHGESQGQREHWGLERCRLWSGRAIAHWQRDEPAWQWRRRHSTVCIWSASFPHFSPHVNASYKRNGSSVLAGNPATGESAHFPDQAGYGVGVELSVNPRLTVAFDVFGRT